MPRSKKLKATKALLAKWVKGLGADSPADLKTIDAVVDGSKVLTIELAQRLAADCNQPWTDLYKAYLDDTVPMEVRDYIEQTAKDEVDDDSMVPLEEIEQRKAIEQMQKSVSGYKLMQVAERIVQSFWEFEGVVTPQLEQEIEDYFGDAAHKLDQYRYVREALNVKRERMRKRARQLSDAARRFETEIKKVEDRALKLLVDAAVIKPEARKWESDHGVVFLSQRDKLVIEDEQAFIEEHASDPHLIKTEIVRTIDRKCVTQRLKNGKTIKGAEMVPQDIVTFR